MILDGTTIQKEIRQRLGEALPSIIAQGDLSGLERVFQAEQRRWSAVWEFTTQDSSGGMRAYRGDKIVQWALGPGRYQRILYEIYRNAARNNLEQAEVSQDPAMARHAHRSAKKALGLLRLSSLRDVQIDEAPKVESFYRDAGTLRQRLRPSKISL